MRTTPKSGSPSQMDALGKVLDAAGLVYQDGAATPGRDRRGLHRPPRRAGAFFTQQSPRPPLPRRHLPHDLPPERGRHGDGDAANAVRGSSQTFTIRPDEGWRIEDVLVNGRSVGPVRYYTVADVRGAIPSAPSSPQAGPGGWVNPFPGYGGGRLVLRCGAGVLHRGPDQRDQRDTFSPAQPLTRAASHPPLPSGGRRHPGAGYGKSPPDVSEDAWVLPPPSCGSAQPDRRGRRDGLFRPDAVISRQEMAVMMARYLTLPSPALAAAVAPKFPDEGTFASWRESILRCGALGLTPGRRRRQLPPRCLRHPRRGRRGPPAPPAPVSRPRYQNFA